jgi:hypothetical protein
LFELIVRFLAYLKKFDCLHDGWFKFDLFLVVTMVVDLWILEPIGNAQGSGHGSVIPLQPLRLLRLLKLSRMGRLLESFPEMFDMIRALVRSLRAVGSSVALVLLMTFTWAILMHSLLKDEDELNDKLDKELMLQFDTMLHCMWTLIVDGALMLDGTAPLMTNLIFSDKVNVLVAGFCFIVYLNLAAMVILQMLIGVLCNVISAVNDETKDENDIACIRDQLSDTLMKHDDGDGQLSQAELADALASHQATKLLADLNINFMFFKEMQRSMFPTPTSTASFEDVLQMMLMCRGDCTATVQALAGGFSFVALRLTEVEHHLSTTVEHIDRQVSSH